MKLIAPSSTEADGGRMRSRSRPSPEAPDEFIWISLNEPNAEEIQAIETNFGLQNSSQFYLGPVDIAPMVQRALRSHAPLLTRCQLRLDGFRAITGTLERARDE